MAITILLRGSAPHLLRYQCTQDGAAGTTATLANATILANATGPLREHWNRAGLDQGEAQQLYSWDARSGVTMSLDVAGNSAVPVKAFAATVDVDMDGRPVVVVSADASAVVGSALLEIRFRHSTGR